MGSHEIVFLIYQSGCLHLSLEVTGYKTYMINLIYKAINQK